MRENVKRTICISLFLLFTSGCTQLVETPTETATLTATIIPTATNTVIPTDTSTPVPMVTLEPTETSISMVDDSAMIEFLSNPLSRIEYVIDGGYSVKIMYNMKIKVTGGETLMNLDDFPIEVIIYGREISDSISDAELLLNSFLPTVGNSDGGTTKVGDRFLTEIDGRNAFAQYFTSKIFGKDLVGYAVALNPYDDQIFFALILTDSTTAPSLWENGGEIFFDDLLASIRFFEIGNQVKGKCEYTSDATYGYTQQNPIRVAGDSELFINMSIGPARARAFLDALLGPNSEVIEYLRIGSEQVTDTIIDKYLITYESQTSAQYLFIDQYSWSPLYVPTGLDCIIPFPLEGP